MGGVLQQQSVHRPIEELSGTHPEGRGEGEDPRIPVGSEGHAHAHPKQVVARRDLAITFDSQV